MPVDRPFLVEELVANHRGMKLVVGKPLHLYHLLSA